MATDKSPVTGLNVFISYSRRNSDFCAKLAESLRHYGFEPVFDTSPILLDDPELRLSAQDEWWKQLKSMIAASDVMVFVVTPASAASNICDDEIAHARNLGKRIIAILRHDIDFNTAPERLRALNVTLDFRDDSNFASAFQALAGELFIDMDWHRRGSRLMRQAQQWDVDGRPQGQLLRTGVIDEADRWAAQRPQNAPEIGPLLQEFLLASREKERQERDERRRIIGRAFVKPARQTIDEGHLVAGIRITAAGLLLSDDIGLEIVPELEYGSGARQAAFLNPARSTIHGPAGATFSPDGLRVVTVRDKDDFAVRIWDRLSGNLMTCLRGHTGWVRMAAFTPDGHRIVTASADGTARVWDTLLGSQVVCLSGHAAHVYTAAFSSNGKRILTASGDRTARIWDAQTGCEIACLSGHLNEVTWAEFCLDDSRVVTTSMDFTARIWRLEPNPRLQSLIMHDGETIASLSADGTRLVTASKGGFVERMVCVWDVATGKNIGQLRTEIGNFTVVKFSPDKQRILAATMENTASVWDTTTLKRLFQLQGHTGSILAADFSPDSSRIATASEDKTIIQWDAANGTALNVFRGHDDQIINATFSSDGQCLATGARDQTVRLWDCFVDNSIASLQCDDSGNIKRVAFSPEGKSILVVGNHARMWDAETFTQIPGRNDPTNLVDAVLSSDGSRIIAISSDQSVIVLETNSGREVIKVTGVIGARILGITVSAESLSRNCEYLVAPLDSDNAVGVWSCASGIQVARLQGHSDAVQYCIFQPDGAQVITLGDNTVRVWDIPSSVEVIRLEESFQVTSAAFSSSGHRMLVIGEGSFSLWDPFQWSGISTFPNRFTEDVKAAFSPDGSTFVTACCGVGIVWDSQTGKPRAELQGNVLGGCFSFSQDGERLATLMPLGRIAIWDVRSGALIGTLPKSSHSTVVALSPDGMRAVTGSRDSAARVWDVARSSVLVGPLSVILAANLMPGQGKRSYSERDDLLMQTAPDDVCTALLERLSEPQRSDAAHRAEVLARGLHPLCYLPPSRRKEVLQRDAITVQDWEKDLTNLSSNPQLNEMAASLIEGLNDGSLRRNARSGKHPGGTFSTVSIRPAKLNESDEQENLLTDDSGREGNLSQRPLANECLNALVSLAQEAESLSSHRDYEAARDLLLVVVDAATRSLRPDSPGLVPVLMRLAESHFALGAFKEAQALEERALIVAAKAGDEAKLDLIRNNLAGTLYEQGDYERARALTEENIEMLTRTLGTEHPRTLLAKHHLGEILKSLGHQLDAQNIFESILETRLRVLGEDDSETLRSMDALAGVYASGGNHALAKKLYQREIEIHAAKTSPCDSNFLTTLNNYAVALQACGELELAGEAFQRVVTGKRGIHGDAHPDVLMAMDSLAITRFHQGDFQAAQPLLETVLSIKRDTLGVDHPESLASLDRLAQFFSKRGDPYPAAQLFRSLSDALVRVRGEDNADTIKAFLNLATTSFAAGDSAGALASLWRAHAARAQKLGEDHTDTALCLQEIGKILVHQTDFVDGARCLTQALEVQKEHLGPEHADTLETMHWLAAARARIGNFEEARTLQQHLLDVSLRTKGLENADTMDSMRNLARTLTAMGDHTAARDLWQKVSDFDTRLSPGSTAALESKSMLAMSLGECHDLGAALSLYESILQEESFQREPEHERTLTITNNLAYLKYVKGDLEEAQRIQEKLVSTESRVLGPEHLATLITKNNLAETLFARGCVEEALSLHTQVLESRRRVLGDDHRDVRASEAKVAKARAAQQATQ